MGEGLPGWLSSKEADCNAGDARDGSIPGSGRSPGEEKWQPTPVFLPGKSRGQEHDPWRREWLLTPVFLPGEFHGQSSLAIGKDGEESHGKEC